MNLNPRMMLPQSGPRIPDAVKLTLTYPVIGMLGAVVGTMVALVAVGDDYRMPGALRVSAAAMAIGLLASAGVSFLKEPRSAFRAEHLVMYGLVYWLLLDLLQGSISLGYASQESVWWSFLAMGTFAASFWAANLAPAFRLPAFLRRTAKLELTPELTVRLALLCFSLAMFNYLYSADFDFELIAVSLLSNRWYAPWNRGQLGGWESFRDHLQYFGYVLPTLTVVVAVRRGWVSFPTLACLVMSLIIMLFLSHSGSRRLVGVTVGSAILFYLLSRPKLSARILATGAVAVFGLLVLLQLIFFLRGTGVAYAYLTDAEVSLGENIVVDDNFLRLAQVIDFFPSKYPYVTYRRLYYTIVRPVPRIFWPDKPVNWGFDLAEALGDRNVSWSSSVIADWWVMYGILTVALGGFLYGRLCSWWSRVLDLGVAPIGILIYSLGAMAIFCSLRQIDELLLQSYPLMGLLLVASFILKPKPSTVPPAE